MFFMTNGNDFIDKLFALQGRVAVITGGGSGIGYRIAKTLAKAGAAVVLVGRRESVLKQAQKTINDNGGRAAYFSADLSQLSATEENAKETASFFGAPDIVVNAAGINLRRFADVCRSTDDITVESWQQTMDINLGAPFFFTRALVGGMKNGGVILNIASLQSLRAGLGDAAYAASKGGVAQLTRTMARAWGKYGITANAIVPGYFPTDMTSAVWADDSLKEKLAENTLLGRIGELADLEGAAVFLVSPAAAYITGVLLPVDGGTLAK